MTAGPFRQGFGWGCLIALGLFGLLLLLGKCAEGAGY